MVDFGKVLGGAASGLVSGGIPGAIAGGLGSLASGSGDKSKETQTANSNQGAQSTQNANGANEVKVAIKADRTVEATGQDPKKAVETALAARQAMDANPPTGQGGFSGQTVQLPKGATISVTT